MCEQLPVVERQGGELLGGLHDVLGEVAVFGNTGDGFYERARVGHSGAAALGLNTGGAVSWLGAEASGVTADPAACTRAALARLDGLAGGRRPKLLLLDVDFHADGSAVERALRDLEMPVVGGFAGDDYRFERCFQYLGDRVLRDSVVLLGAYGELEFDIRIGNTLRPVGAPGRITQALGTRVLGIDGIGAMDFVLRETGKPVLRTDRGSVAMVVADAANPAIKRIRSVMPVLDDPGSVVLAGGIEAGQSVQVCFASPEALIAEVYAIAARARERIAPRAAVVFSCGGRKEVLGGQIEHEIIALSQAFPDGLPLVGFPSLGEFGPLRDATGGYTSSLFHNMTFVLLLVGEKA